MAEIGFVWNEEKCKKTLKKHGVTFAEVVSAFDDESCLIDEDPIDPSREIMIAMTSSRRLLFVVYAIEETTGFFRIITAFDAPQEWKDEYHKDSP